jgi:hypothetical protein
MKIRNLLQDVLVEEVKNKKLFNLLLTKWREQKHNLGTDEAESLLNRFGELKNGLNPNKAQVISFLNRFDGRHGYERFDPDLLKDITKYTYRQIRSLVDEYSDDDNPPVQQIPNVFLGKDKKSTPEKIEASKSLWFEGGNAIINEEGFRVYAIADQAMSIRFGYYAEAVNKEQGGGIQSWCVTWRGGGMGENRWGSYRDTRTFYFVIDENRDPKKDRYYLGALQRVTGNANGYILTSVRNDGDNVMNWSEICKIYPKLVNHKELIVPKKFSEEEMQEKDIVGMINEHEGSPYEFKRIDRTLKKAYIENSGELKKPESWAAMDEKLRALYIVTTTAQQIQNKFSNYEFIEAIRKVGNEFSLLDNRMKQLGFRDGVGHIMINLIKSEFRLTRESLNNAQIKIFESKVTSYYGIYNSRAGSWLKFDGITYEPLFKQTDTDVYFDEDETGYFVEKYDKKGGNESFYCIYPSETEQGDCYILSQKKWEELKPRLYIDKEQIPRVSNFDTDQDVDIKETKKRV